MKLLRSLFLLLLAGTATTAFSQSQPSNDSTPQTLTNKTINTVTSYAPSGDTTGATDVAAVNALLTSGVSVALASGGHYYSTGGSTVDISKQSLIGNGAIWDCTPMSGASTCLNVTATVGGTNNDAQHERFTISGLQIRGSASNLGTGVSISASAEPAAAYINFTSLSIEHFNVCELVGNYTYDLDHTNVVWNECVTGISIPNGLTQAFERFHINGGAITNSTTGINDQNGNGNIFLEGTSLTFNGIFILTNHGATVYCKNCHIETAVGSTTNSWIQAEGGVGNTITIDGGAIFANGTGPGGWPSIFDIASGSNVVLTGGTLLNNLANTGNTLETGAGTLTINPPTPTFGGSNPPIVATGSTGSDTNVITETKKDISSSTNTLYPTTAAETAAGLTPVNQWYPPSEAWRYMSSAQIADAIARTLSIDDSAALNNACIAAWVNGNQLHIPGGSYSMSAPLALPCISAESRGDAFIIYGDGAGDPFSAASFTNTTLLVASGTAQVMTSGPGGGAGTGTGNMEIRDIRFECNNTTACINATVWSYTLFKRNTLLQSGTGDGIDIARSIYNDFEFDMFMNSGKVTTGGAKTGTGINITQSGGNGGIATINMVLTAGWQNGIQIGTGGVPIENVKITNTAVQASTNGIIVGSYANKTVIENVYSETISGTVIQDLGNYTTVKDSYFFPGFLIGIDGSSHGAASTQVGTATYTGNTFNINANNSFGIEVAGMAWYEAPTPNAFIVEGNAFDFGCGSNVQTGIAISGTSPNVWLNGNTWNPDTPEEAGCAIASVEIVDTSTSLGVVGQSQYIVAHTKFPLLSNVLLTKSSLLGSSTGYTTLASANSSATNYTATFPANTGTVPELNLAQSWSAAQTFSGGITSAANAYSLITTGLSLTSGTTGFGRDLTGTVNDSSAVDGIADFVNITCTLCTATSYFTDYQVSGSSKWKVDVNGNVTQSGFDTPVGVNVTGSSLPTTGIYRPATNQLGFAAASTAAGLIDATEHWRIGGVATPTISSGACGATTNGTLSAASNDHAGEVIIGAATTTICTITFSAAYTTAPRAVLLTAGNAAAAAVTVLPYISSIGTANFVITGSVLANTSFYYWVQ